MIQRRAKKAGILTAICCHSFRATGITNYLEHGGTLEKAQAMAAHESPKTTKLYDRTSTRSRSTRSSGSRSDRWPSSFTPLKARECLFSQVPRPGGPRIRASSRSAFP